MKSCCNGSESVFAIGSTVYVGGDLEAQVIGVMIEGTGTTYKCAWWAEKDRKEAWLEECEVSAHPESSRSRIGFVPQYVQEIG